MMSNRGSAFVLVLLMLIPPLSSLDLSGGDEVSEQEFTIPTVEYIRIEPDADSVRGISPAAESYTGEKARESVAETRLGVYDVDGLNPTRVIPKSLSAPRFDLVMVVVDGEVGLWPAQEEIASLRGVVIQAHIPPSGFIVQGEAKSLLLLEKLPSVVAVHPIPIAMFVSDELLHVGDDSEIALRVEGWRSADYGIPLDGVALNGWHFTVQEAVDGVMRVSEVVESGRIEGVVNSRDIATLSANPAVSWLRPPPPFELHNSNARNHMEVGSVVTAFGTTLNGSGQIVAVADSGIDQDHGDMNGRINNAVSVVSGDSSSEDTHSGHGTHVACTVLGDGSRGGYAGVAPEANLYFQAMERDSDGQFYSPSMNYLLNAAYNSGARIHTNSWGAQTNYGQYTTDSADVDDRMNHYDQYWSYDGLAVLFSAGNDGDGSGTISPPATAKNQIAVGNHHNRGGGAPNTLATSSSRGPTDDGRLKPDVTAPGAWVRSCRSQDAADISTATWSSQWYLEYSGTSMAAPNAAGASALIREYLVEVAQRPQPQGALVKALLILGAEDMGTRDIPNNDEGWGRVNLARSLTTIGDTGVWVDDRNFLRSGNQRDYTFNLTEGWQQFKVVLAWSDYRGSTWSTDQLQNDLDLVVTAPDGTTQYLGNVFQNGRSTTGGTADDINNVEVVLIDQAEKGVWTVSVADVRHGGQKSEQTYALAIRGAGVDDLSPDAAFVASSFSLSDPIPQVGESVTFSVQASNMGSRTMDDLQVRATAGGTLISTQTISLGPGEVRGLNWQWTPTSNGDNNIIIEADPTDAFEELDEANNVFQQTVGVTEPGVRLSAASVVKSVNDAASSITQWDLTIRNTALVPTNATISSTKPVRTSDGVQFNGWIQSFSQTTFSLNASESVAVGLTLGHPAPPEPGIYQFAVTGEDVDNQLQYEMTLTLDVPVLPGFRFSQPSLISVSPVENTSFSVTMFNEGNGAQGWDLELESPAGWDLGFDSLAAISGSPSASSGFIPSASSKVADITLVPPTDILVSEGVSMSGLLRATSQIDASRVWEVDLDFVVTGHHSALLSNESTYGTLRPDSQLNLRFTVQNQGNVDLALSASMELPGGWDVTNQLPTMNLQPSESKSLVVAIKGNGRAASGPITLAMVDPSGYRAEWTGLLEVVTTPKPSVSFDEIILADGRRSTSILGLGDHPVGLPGFRLVWLVTNSGAQAWTPQTDLLLPSSGWTGLCDPLTSPIEPGRGERIECLVVMPATTPAGSEPTVTLRVVAEDVQVANSVSLHAAITNKVQWQNLVEADEFKEGSKASYSIELINDGNSPLSYRLSATAPDGWSVSVVNTDLVELQPGEARTIDFEVYADQPGNGTVVLSLSAADDVEGSAHSIDLSAADDPMREVTSGGSAVVWVTAILILVALAGAIAVVTMRMRQKEGSPTILNGISGFFSSPPPPPFLPTGEMMAPDGVESSDGAARGEMAHPPSSSAAQSLPPPPVGGLPPPPTSSGGSSGTANSRDIGGGAFPLPPPPNAQPTSAPPSSAFQSTTTGDVPCVNDEGESTEVAGEAESGAEQTKYGGGGLSPRHVAGEAESGAEQTADANHKCWVCLEHLPPSGFQACPKCGARYHKQGNTCGIANLQACRNCSGATDEFVQVG